MAEGEGFELPVRFRVKRTDLPDFFGPAITGGWHQTRRCRIEHWVAKDLGDVCPPAAEFTARLADAQQPQARGQEGDWQHAAAAPVGTETIAASCSAAMSGWPIRVQSAGIRPRKGVRPGRPAKNQPDTREGRSQRHPNATASYWTEPRLRRRPVCQEESCCSR